MSVLDFLSPAAARAEDGFDPVARSSMERRYREAGAIFEERDGWLVATAVAAERDYMAAVGIADLSHLAKLEVRPAVSESAAVVTYRISPRRSLLLYPAARAAAVREQLVGADFVLDVTAQYGILALAGPEASAVIRRLTHLHDFPASGAVAHMTAHVIARDGGFWIVFPQEFGHYLYEVAIDCAAALGGGPVGVDAIGASS